MGAIRRKWRLGHMIDAREMPKDWQDELVPIQGAGPNIHPLPALHSQWVIWFIRLTPNWLHGHINLRAHCP